MRSALLFAMLALSLGAGCSSAPDPAPAASMSATPAATHLGAWYWIGSTSGGQTLLALDPARYQIDFADAATILVQADCNRGRAAYSLDAGAFSVGPIGLTRMACPADSQDREFLAQLASGKSLNPADNGLSIELAEGRGTMHFARDPKSSLPR